MKKVVSTERAPKAIGPYSQAVIHNGLAYLSGQIPTDPATGEMVAGGVAEQTERVIENLKAVLEAAGASLASVVKTTVFLKDMGDFPKMNEVYARYFAGESAGALDGAGGEIAARRHGRDRRHRGARLKSAYFLASSEYYACRRARAIQIYAPCSSRTGRFAAALD